MDRGGGGGGVVGERTDGVLHWTTGGRTLNDDNGGAHTVRVVLYAYNNNNTYTYTYIYIYGATRGRYRRRRRRAPRLHIDLMRSRRRAVRPNPVYETPCVRA